MKAFCVVSRSRQVDGDFMALRFERCFTTLDKAREFARTLPAAWTESLGDGNQASMHLCERSIHEIEVEE